MRLRIMLAGVVAAASFAPSALAQLQNDTGIPTETQERLRRGDSTNDALNWLGLLGLIGLYGLKRGHSEDSYHPSSLD